MAIEMKYGRKNAWRRWAWNRIVELLTVVPKDAKGVYLPGPNDLDRTIALSKGFQDKNLIAVEKSKDTVRDLKRFTDTDAIWSDVGKVLTTWPLKDPINFVHLDFWGGFSKGVWQSLLGIGGRWRYDRVVSLNLYRGRGNTLLQGVTADPHAQDLAKQLKGVDRYHVGLVAALSFWSHLGALRKRVLWEEEGWYGEREDVNQLIENLRGKMLVVENGRPFVIPETVQGVIDYARISTHSYRTITGQHFDSVVFRVPALWCSVDLKNVALYTPGQEADAARRRKVVAS